MKEHKEILKDYESKKNIAGVPTNEICKTLGQIRVRLHITEMKSHPGMKRVEFHPGVKFNLKENLLLSMMKTDNEISHFSQLLKSEA